MQRLRVKKTKPKKTHKTMSVKIHSLNWSLLYFQGVIHNVLVKLTVEFTLRRNDFTNTIICITVVQDLAPIKPNKIWSQPLRSYSWIICFYHQALRKIVSSLSQETLSLKINLSKLATHIFLSSSAAIFKLLFCTNLTKFDKSLDAIQEQSWACVGTFLS